MRVALRRTGGTSTQESGVVEYDADSEDDGWLENINRGQDRLSVHKFELMIWKLELANAAANERTLSAAGALALTPTSFVDTVGV